MQDTRNVTDQFKGWGHNEIVDYLDTHGSALEIAIENTLRDFNMGTIVRSANAFGVRKVHVIGRKQWNKRGAMATDKYMSIIYHESIAAFCENVRDRTIIAVDNVKGSVPLVQTTFDKDTILVFGQEGPGISEELTASAQAVVHIEQFGSTRSINVGVAAGIVMYEYTRQHLLSDRS